MGRKESNQSRINVEDPDENVGEHRISSGSKQFANIKAIFKDINIIMRKFSPQIPYDGSWRILKKLCNPPMQPYMDIYTVSKISLEKNKCPDCSSLKGPSKRTKTQEKSCWFHVDREEIFTEKYCHFSVDREVGWLVLLLYVPSQQLWSLRDCQFT